jgi:predicted DNA-binding protein with PD1-like motif
MITTAEGKIKRIVPVRLGPGEDVLKGIAAACEKHGIKNGVLIGAIGSLKHARVLNQMPVSVKDEKIVYDYPEKPQEWGGLQGVLELCSTEGLIYHTEDGKSVPQLHCTFSNAAGTVIGGHMVEGTIVMLTLEISIAELEEVDLLCKQDPATGKLVFTATQL